MLPSHCINEHLNEFNLITQEAVETTLYDPLACSDVTIKKKKQSYSKHTPQRDRAATHHSLSCVTIIAKLIILVTHSTYCSKITIFST